MRSIYVIGSLRNDNIPKIANEIERHLGIEAFDDWYSPGPETDDRWRDHEMARGNPFPVALYGYHARNVFEFDKRHLDRCDAAVLVMPAGKSGHLELGYMVGKGKPAYVLFDGVPERWDIMYQFATGVFFSLDEFINFLRGTMPCSR